MTDHAFVVAKDFTDSHTGIAHHAGEVLTGEHWPPERAEKYIRKGFVEIKAETKKRKTSKE